MTDQTNAEREDRVVLAFSPSDADHADDGYIWTLYNTALENPYSVANGDTKINNAVERINPNEYTLGENEHWVRFDAAARLQARGRGPRERARRRRRPGPHGSTTYT